MDKSGELTERYFLLLLIDAVKYAYLSLDSKIDKTLEHSYSRSGLVSSTILLESLANLLIDQIPSSPLRNDLDKLPFLSKIDVYLIFKRSTVLDRGRSEVQRALELKSMRDSFVHPKKRKHAAARVDPADSISYNIQLSSHAQTKISVSPSQWQGEDCLIAVKSAIALVRHVLVDKLLLSTEDAFSIVCSEFVVDESRAILTETELSETSAYSKKLGVDLTFLLPAELVSP